MKTRNLTQEELQMLGLQEGTITVTVKDNPKLQKYVGKFASVDGHYGMVDDVHGNKLGFVWSNKDSWTAELVSADDIELCESEENIKKARNSAKCYFNREETSLRSRIRMKYRIDNETELKNMLSYIVGWNRKI